MPINTSHTAPRHPDRRPAKWRDLQFCQFPADLKGRLLIAFYGSTKSRDMIRSDGAIAVTLYCGTSLER
jgi:hypothetical protein